MTDKDAWKYFKGDTWDFWIGALDTQNTENGKIHRENVKRVFQSINLTEDIIDRIISGLLGKMPIFGAKLQQLLQNEENDEDPSAFALQQFASNLYQDLLVISAEMSSQDLLFSNCWEMFLTCALVQETGYLRVCLIDDNNISIHAVDPEAIEVLQRDQLGRLRKVKYTFEEENDKGEKEEINEIQTLTKEGFEQLLHLYQLIRNMIDHSFAARRRTLKYTRSKTT
ncbi:MAG: hypothetical protein F6K24_02820, partial [Okeania sp. SIO2D1]|nr:hypothetical protein [Okeania sp. SIO2D1]